MKLNPQIRTIEIGIRELREVTIYPMSLADQLKLSNIISESIEKLQDQSVLSNNAGLLLFIIDFIRDKAPIILKSVLDKDENIDNFMENITNEQFVEFVKILIEVNFEPLAKNLKRLLKKEENVE